jgi:AAA15 family ATPase/GTPase
MVSVRDSKEARLHMGVLIIFFQTISQSQERNNMKVISMLET